MFYQRFGDTVVVRLEKGEELAAALRKVCETEKIRLGTVSGLGAMDHVAVGVYDAAAKQFCPAIFDEPLEMTALAGNVTQKDGKAYIHLHASFGRADGGMLGGHLSEARVSATAELFIRVVNGAVSRVYDEGTGLNLLEFPAGTPLRL